MKIIKITLAISLTALAGCVSVDPVQESSANPSVSALEVSCGKPIGFTQDCSSFSGAKRKIEIEGQTIRIAGNTEGNAVLIMDGEKLKNTFTQNPFVFNNYKSSRAVNNAFYLIKSVLQERAISVINTHSVRFWGDIHGYVIELDGNGYDALKAYSVNGD